MSLKIVEMGKYRARDTVAVLTVLLEQAKRGELTGVALTARKADGTEDMFFTDTYRRRVTRATHAAVRMYWRSMQIEDAAEMADSIQTNY